MKTRINPLMKRLIEHLEDPLIVSWQLRRPATDMKGHTAEAIVKQKTYEVKGRKGIA